MNKVSKLCLSLVIMLPLLFFYVVPLVLEFCLDSSGSPEGAREHAVCLTMNAVLSASKNYYKDCGEWPDLEKVVSSLRYGKNDGRWKGPYISSLHPIECYMGDSWGNDFRFKIEQQKFNMISSGEDEIFDTTDDIVGWITPDLEVVLKLGM